VEAKPALQLPPRAAPLQVYVRACSTDLHKQKSTTPRLVWLHVPSHFSAIGSELYVMEQYHDNKLVGDWSVFEQAYECFGKGLDRELMYLCVPQQFVAMHHFQTFSFMEEFQNYSKM